MLPPDVRDTNLTDNLGGDLGCDLGGDLASNGTVRTVHNGIYLKSIFDAIFLLVDIDEGRGELIDAFNVLLDNYDKYPTLNGFNKWSFDRLVYDHNKGNLYKFYAITKVDNETMDIFMRRLDCYCFLQKKNQVAIQRRGQRQRQMQESILDRLPGSSYNAMNLHFDELDRTSWSHYGCFNENSGNCYMVLNVLIFLGLHLIVIITLALENNIKNI